jgi:hypothetical protein
MDPALLARFFGSAMRAITLQTLASEDADAVGDAKIVVSLFLNGAGRRR